MRFNAILLTTMQYWYNHNYNAKGKLNHNSNILLTFYKLQGFSCSNMAHNPRLSYCWRDVGATDNLAELSKLDENRILIELKARYLNDEIYTYVGDILIAVNPLKDLHIYGKKTALAYKNAKLSEQPPHIYATASHVYKCMLGVEYDADPHSQCIVISGESGAGKTESTKLVVKQIIELCNGNTQLEQQILQVNPLLEAFGNAKTVINENSSRFGKYIQLLFHSGKVVGAKISEYLLEKSRVVHQNAGDANFHIFNYMFAGCSEEQRQTFKLGSRENYRYTKSCDQTADATFYQNKFEQLQNAMDLVGFSEEEQDDLLAVLSGVLSVGNVDFADKVSSERVGVSQVDDLAAAAHLFGVKPTDLQECLTRLTNSTRGEQIIINFSRTQAEDARDAVAKVIYGRLFSWIVNKINQRLSPDQRSIDQLEIGILDIFGFENFASNSFEQACINLANEHLQYFFNEHIFSLEQEEYKSEGIKWSHISYSDNQPLLDLFLKKMGILALLDEESHFPQGTDASFVDKLNKNLSSHECYKKQRAARTPRFAIQHYAGHVTYDVKNWLEKNRDTIPPSLMSMLKQSSNLLLRTIFKGNITRTGTLALQNRTRKSVTAKQPIRPSTSAPSNSKKLTVGTQFKNSLQELIRQMSKANPHFIRCLKPNASRLAGEFDDKYILSQVS
ncbi:hypothetical protein EB796_022501 [Bugula neritina]|uniref:Myosin motor domain-containing protein n=1 Tax=Bugula neritina TaxID=10212 RepID=A0A7J7J184_BUGNE|nr:hypothetical protein EB796_022501 [Bugula neritina]